MPVVDMPLEELEHYNGINPRPDDFDEYWSVALEEVSAAGTDVEWEDVDFSAMGVRCRSMFFRGVGGSRIHAKVLMPENPTGTVPALLHFHGYTMSSSPWSDYLKFAAAGIAVFAMDCRGQAGLSEDHSPGNGPTLYGNIVRGLEGNPEDLHYREVFQDVAQLARIALSLPDIDPARVGAYGGSQGGALAVVCGALEPRIRCLTTTYPFLADYRRVWEMDLADKAYKGLRDYFRRFDPLHEREEEIFRTLGYIDIVNLAPRITGSVLFAGTLMDDICPPSTQFAVYNRMNCEKKMVLYRDFGHEGIPDFEDRIYTYFTSRLLADSFPSDVSQL